MIKYFKGLKRMQKYFVQIPKKSRKPENYFDKRHDKQWLRNAIVSDKLVSTIGMAFGKIFHPFHTLVPNTMYYHRHVAFDTFGFSFDILVHTHTLVFLVLEYISCPNRTRLFYRNLFVKNVSMSIFFSY